MRAHICLILVLGALTLGGVPAKNSSAESREIKLGVIASLSSFAGEYGQAVVDGASLAAEELNAEGVQVKLFVEDDGSEIKNGVTAYRKLRAAHQIDALVGASWWLNSIVKTVERDQVPFISCETLYNKDFVEAPNYFTLGGDLRSWPRAFSSLIEARGWRSLLMVRFVSGFADTIEAELRSMFSAPGRSFLEPIVYGDIELSAAPALALRVLTQKPQVVFVDAQPEGFAQLMRELVKIGAKNLSVITYDIAINAAQQQLFDARLYDGRLFALRRQGYKEPFLSAFRSKYKREPQLNADLGYYATRLIAEAIRKPGSPVAALKTGLTVSGITFSFDQHNVSQSVTQDVYGFLHGKPFKLEQ